MEYRGHKLLLGKNVTTADEVHDFASHGFEYFEIDIPRRPKDDLPYSSPEYAMRIVEQVEDAARAVFEENLCVWSVHLPFGGAWDIASADENECRRVVGELKKVIDLTHEWGTRIYVVHGCLEPVRDCDRAIRLGHSISSLRELNDYAEKYGARIALEDLPRSCLGNCSGEMRTMIQGAGNIPVCFDVNHLLHESHSDFMAALAPFVVTTHLSDYDGVDERHWLPGEGIVPWKQIVSGLLDAGYRGPFLFEVDRDRNGNEVNAQAVLDGFEKALL